MELNREKRRKEIQDMINNYKSKKENGEVDTTSNITKGITAREHLKHIQENGLPTYFDYPGGFDQYKKDIESGMYD